MSGLTYAGEELRRHERERFFLSLFVPARKRPAIWALLAFNFEIAKTREVVTDTTLGLIRLQWWRDALAQFYGQGHITPHGIMDDLCKAIETHDLPREDFDNLLYAREFDLEDVPPDNLQGLENYADFTTTPLFRLCARVCGYSAQEGDETFKHLAVAHALTGLMRAVPAHAQANRCYLPKGMMDARGLSLSALARGRSREKYTAIIGDICACAQDHVDKARPGTGYPRFFRAVAAHTRLYLNTLAKCGYDPLDNRLNAGPAFKELRIALRAVGSIGR